MGEASPAAGYPCSLPLGVSPCCLFVHTASYCDRLVDARLSFARSASRTAVLHLMRIERWAPVRVAWMGPIRSFPAGMPMQACRSLPHSFSSCLRCIDSLRVTLWIFAVSLLILSSGRSMHRRVPSKIQPNSSCRVVHKPSPGLSFLRDTGSSPSCPVTDGGGKTE